MNNFLLTLGGILLAVLTAAVAVPPLIDWNQYRGAFEEEVSRFVGREVRVGGNVQLRILPAPYVGFEDVRIADAPGISGSFIRVKRFTLWLAVPPLLRGILEARKIEINEPHLRLRLLAKGRGNWQLLNIRGSNLPFVPKEIALRSVNIRDGRVTIENDNGDAIGGISGVNGELSAGALRGPYKFNGTIGKGSAEHRLRASSAPPASDGSVHLKATVRSTSLGTDYAIDGTLKDLSSTPKLVGTIKVRAPLILRANRDRPIQVFSQSALKGERQKQPQIKLQRKSPAKPGGNPSSKYPPSYFNLTSNLSANVRKLELKNLAIAFSGAGRRQLLSGSALATWESGLAIRSSLSSRWLDLDALLGIGKTQSPLQGLAALASHQPSVAIMGGTRLDVLIDHATLGQASVRDLRLQVSHTQGVSRAQGISRVGRVQVRLPGRTKLIADGLVTTDDNGSVFDGHIMVSGSHFGRFAEWAKLRLPKISGHAGGAFALDADLKLGPRIVAIDKALARFASGEMRGGLRYDWKARPRLVINGDIQGSRLSGFGPELLSSQDVAIALGFGGKSLSGKPSSTGGSARAGNAKSESTAENARVGGALSRFVRGIDLDLQLRGQEITDGVRTIRRFNVALVRQGVKLRIAQARFVLGSGLVTNISGAIDLSGAQTRGTLKGVVQARDASSVGDLVANFRQFAGLKPAGFQRPSKGAGASAVRNTISEMGALAPMRMAFSAELGLGKNGDTIIRGDGVVRGDRVRASVESAGILASWRRQALRVDLHVSGRDALATSRWLRGMPHSRTLDVSLAGKPTGKFGGAGGQPRIAMPLEFRFNASGVPQSGMVSVVTLDSEPLGATVSANVTLDDNDHFHWTGRAHVNSASLAMAARVFAPNLLAFAKPLPVAGRIDLERQAGVWRIEPRDLNFGPARVNGLVQLAARGGLREIPIMQVSADLQLDRASLSGMMQPLLRGAAPRSVRPLSSGQALRGPQRRERISVRKGNQTITGKLRRLSADAGRSVPQFWSDLPFDLSVLNGFGGTIKLKVARLNVAPELSVDNARLEVEFKPGRLVLRSASAGLNLGTVSLSAQIEEAPAGIIFSGMGKLSGLDLNRYASQSLQGRRALHGRLGGKVQIAVAVKGQALSPSSLISQLHGKGSIKLRRVLVPGIGADKLSALSLKVLSGEIQPVELNDALKRAVGSGSIKIPQSDLNFTIAGGVMEIAPFDVGRDGHQVENRTTVDMLRWMVDSEWRIRPKALALPDLPAEKRLPSLRLVYAGPLARLSNADPHILAGNLQRELTVRRMEVDVARLERLRRKDEERAKAEKERRGVLEIERKKALEAERLLRLNQERQRRRLQELQQPPEWIQPERPQQPPYLQRPQRSEVDREQLAPVPTAAVPSVVRGQLPPLPSAPAPSSGLPLARDSVVSGAQTTVELPLVHAEPTPIKQRVRGNARRRSSGRRARSPRKWNGQGAFDSGAMN